MNAMNPAEALEALYVMGYSRPSPSLCDNCRFSYHLEHGSVSYGGKTYLQRYCDPLSIAIHSKGKVECAVFQAKQVTILEDSH